MYLNLNLIIRLNVIRFSMINMMINMTNMMINMF